MGASLGSNGGKHAAPQLNVTPLVDVALVVLIIFMVVSPMLTRTFRVDVPEAATDSPSQASSEPLLLVVAPDGALTLNRTPIGETDIASSLPPLLATQAQPVLHVDAADVVPYGRVVSILDACRAAGAKTIAIVTKPATNTKAN